MTTISLGTPFNLGTLRSEHRLASLPLQRYLRSGIAATAIAVLMLLTTPIVAGQWLPLAGVIALAFLLLGIWHLYSYQTEKSSVLRLYEAGLIYARGGKTAVFFWDDLEHVYLTLNHNSRANIHHLHCQLHQSNGRRLAFDFLDKEMADIKLISDTIQRHIIQHQLPLMLAQFHRGQIIDFGPIKLDQIGITAGKKSMLWQEVESLRIQMGMINIRQRGQRRPWARVAAAKTANAFLLAVLVDQILWS